jgi:hypothetical protein
MSISTEIWKKLVEQYWRAAVLDGDERADVCLQRPLPTHKAFA